MDILLIVSFDLIERDTIPAAAVPDVLRSVAKNGYTPQEAAQKEGLKKLNENFKKNSYSKLLPCKNVIDYNYKKKLDSLYNIDQYYRNLSKGNYGIYKNELTRTDSITSNNLYKIIQEKGFPNEYNIGISSDNETFFHN